ncbi:MAG: hypothetical protein IPM98_18465 [Lewinellaceae bacterium]|nr:hypothetical protein [Lewinellaceae bacterium]
MNIFSAALGVFTKRCRAGITKSSAVLLGENTKQGGKENAHRAERHVRKQACLRRRRRLSPDRLEAGLNSWLGHVRFGQCRRMENRVLRMVRAQRVNVVEHPSGSWRVLER